MHNSALAQSVITSQCSGIESTSDAALCLKDQLTDAEHRLHSIFVSMTKKREDKTQEKLISSQRHWNEYKKEYCLWESQNTSSPSEEHLKLISCKTLLTEQRIDLLNKQLHQNIEEPIEYGQLPRWLNVIAFDYPNVFWQYNKRIETDLNCDGSKEWIMIGTSLNRKDFKAAQETPTQTNDNLYAMDFVVTIAENPKIGRPQSQLFKIPLNQNTQGVHLCSPIVELQNKKSTENKNCSSSIEISDNSCQTIHIYWNDNDYKISQPNSDKNE